jgi:hypothetical protein
MMYRERKTREGKLTHSTACRRSFDHYDKQCPRCLELMKGAEPRKGWRKKLDPQQRLLFR